MAQRTRAVEMPGGVEAPAHGHMVVQLISAAPSVCLTDRHLPEHHIYRQPPRAAGLPGRGLLYRAKNYDLIEDANRYAPFYNNQLRQAIDQMQIEDGPCPVGHFETAEGKVEGWIYNCHRAG